MIIVRCKDCRKELTSHPTKTQCCGCPNMMTVKGESVSAVDLSNVVLVNSIKEKKKSSFFSPEDLAYQEARRSRKVRKMNFEVR
jgi:hypothetical protein